MPGQEITVDEQRTFSVDGLLPSTVMRPNDAGEAARDLHACDEGPAAVVVWGGGTQMRLGAPPRRYEVAFSTERMTRLLEYEPADLTCRVEAGMRLSDLQAALRAQGQRLPLDPPHPEHATVGGMVAANTNGLTRGRYGTVRDWVIGIAVAYPSGKVARAGGKVVKNVAGYDLMKLHIGALGTLGVVAEVNFKVQARPEAEATLLAHFEAPGPALAVGLKLARQYLAPAAAIVLDGETFSEFLPPPHAGEGRGGGPAQWTLALKLEGYAREVDAAKDVAIGFIHESGGVVDEPGIPPSFWDAARDWSAPADEGVVLRAVVPLNSSQNLIAAVRADARVLAQPASGVVDVRVPATSAAGTLSRLRDAAGAEGQVVVAAAPVAVKQAVDVWGPPPPGFPIMRALKQALDPNGILNPGRFVGGI
ncbi:MAG TPA: FAD-binding oxidoreductase [Candidatus Dormibacteraeota bacterium]|nr:FAD-binding oxidoreductase [Candidatus Dormibacteraeota bacterium]